jgi:hypothetical protein
MHQMTLDAMLIGNAVDHDLQVPILNGLDLFILKNDNRGHHDNAADQTAGSCIRSYYGCHMTLRCNSRRCRESGRDKHQYKTSSHDIVPKTGGKRKH